MYSAIVKMLEVVFYIACCDTFIKFILSLLKIFKYIFSPSFQNLISWYTS